MQSSSRQRKGPDGATDSSRHSSENPPRRVARPGRVRLVLLVDAARHGLDDLSCKGIAPKNSVDGPSTCPIVPLSTPFSGKELLDQTVYVWCYSKMPLAIASLA